MAVVSSRAGLREGTGSRRPLRCLSKEQRRHAQEVGDRKAPAAVYANQVQVHVLALRNAELEQTAAAWSRNWRRWKRQ